MPDPKPSSPRLDLDHDLADDLLAYWLFSEGSGATARDLGPHNLHLTLANDPTWGSDDQGPHLSFVAADSQYGATPATTAFNVSRFTVAARFKNPADSQYRRLFTWADPTYTDGFSLFVLNSIVYIHAHISTGLFGWGRPLGTPDSDGYHTAICRFDQSFFRFNVDGNAASLARSTSLTPVSPATSAYVAAKTPADEHFDEIVQAIGLWSASLSDDLVTELESDFFGLARATPAKRLWPIGPHVPLFLSAPFDGSGVSVYASTGHTVTYRRLRALPRKRPPLRLGTEFPIANESVAKTARIASQAADPGEEIEIEVDLSDYAGNALTVDVRHYRDHVENTGSQPRRLLLDGDGNSDDEIRGRAILLTPEVRAGGIVRIRWRWEPSRDGLQPDLFKLQRTAGPTSPADVTTSNVGRGVYELDTPALSDSSAYTYQLIAQNTAGTVTATLLSGISITADATGPTAPGSLTIDAV